MSRASVAVTGIGGMVDPDFTAGALRMKAARISGRLGSSPAIRPTSSKGPAAQPAIPARQFRDTNRIRPCELPQARARALRLPVRDGYPQDPCSRPARQSPTGLAAGFRPYASFHAAGAAPLDGNHAIARFVPDLDATSPDLRISLQHRRGSLDPRIVQRGAGPRNFRKQRGDDSTFRRRCGPAATRR